MATKSTNPNVITATGTGQSEYVDLPPGWHAVDIYCGGTCTGTLQRGDGTNFNDLYDQTNAAADFSSSGKLNFLVAGNCSMCLQVDSWATSLVATFKEVERP